MYKPNYLKKHLRLYLKNLIVYVNRKNVNIKDIESETKI